MPSRFPEDATCDYSAIYLEGKPIALRPHGVDPLVWRDICEILTGYGPRMPCAPQHEAPPPRVADAIMWLRLDKFMDDVEASKAQADPSLRSPEPPLL